MKVMTSGAAWQSRPVISAGSPGSSLGLMAQAWASWLMPDLRPHADIWLNARGMAP